MSTPISLASINMIFMKVMYYYIAQMIETYAQF